MSSYKQFIPKMYGFIIYGKRGSKYYEKVKMEKKFAKEKKKENDQSNRDSFTLSTELKGITNNFKLLSFK